MKVLKWFLSSAVLYGLLIMGPILEYEWADNLFMFMIWFVWFMGMATFMIWIKNPEGSILRKKVQEGLVAPVWVELTINLIVVAILASLGRFVLATLYAMDTVLVIGALANELRDHEGAA